MSNPQDIWNALIANGASPIQAAGIMGNMYFESSLNPESAGVDSNGYKSYGLIQWNSAPSNYPNASSLVTGNPAQDISAQIKFLAQTGGFKAASGSTASQAGSNFAANYERCSSCQAGGAQNSSRAAKASEYFSAAQSGKWPQGSSDANASPASAQSASYDSATCLIGSSGAKIGPVPLSSGTCYMSNTEARALLGGLVMGVGSVMFLAGAVILVAFTFRKAQSAGITAAVNNSVSAINSARRIPRRRKTTTSEDSE